MGCVYPGNGGGVLGGDLTWLISRGDGVGGRGKWRGFPGVRTGCPQGVSVADHRKTVRLNTFCLDCTSSGSFIGSHERDEEDAVVLENGSGGRVKGFASRDQFGEDAGDDLRVCPPV